MKYGLSDTKDRSEEICKLITYKKKTISFQGYLLASIRNNLSFLEKSHLFLSFCYHCLLVTMPSHYTVVKKKTSASFSCCSLINAYVRPLKAFLIKSKSKR
jgi:hypothetical protein